jgi:hypothetical protein
VGADPVMHDRVFELSDLVEIHPLSPALDNGESKA